MSLRFLIILTLSLNRLFCGESHIHARRPDPIEKVGYVVADEPVWRRLGNQLFCISSILAYAWDNGFHPIFPALNRMDNQLSYNRDRLFYLLDTDASDIQIHYRYKHRTLRYEPLPPFKNTLNIALRGQFFSWKFFHHHRDDLLELYKPSSEITTYLHAKYADLIEASNTVAVHVRTYSKSVHEEGLMFLGLNYFKKAIERFPSEFLFVVFSDRVNWTKHHFLELFPDRNFIFIEGNDHIEDLFLLSMMKHQIMSNSTYSWWGAYLNQNPDQKVICPKIFFRDASVLPLDEFYLPEWIIVEDDYSKDPYPEDIQAYDPPTADDLMKY